MYTIKTEGKELSFETQEGVFYPTNTSELLVAGARQTIKKQGKLLDLGCGTGVIGITLAELKLAEMPIYASDLSAAAVLVARQNARDHGCEMIAKTGPLFEPWRGEKFDVIVDDVPGITEEVAALSRWFSKSIPCASGKDGTELVSRVIQEAPEYLLPGGVLIFPALSLSNTGKLIDLAKKKFGQVQRIARRTWSLPDELKPHLDFLKKLQSEGKIRLEEKFGMTLWYTEVYAAYC